MKYSIHVGVGIEDARCQSPICEFNHEFLAQLVEVVEKQPALDVVVNDFDINSKYIELGGKSADLKKFKDELVSLHVEESTALYFECFARACDKAVNNDMHLYVIME